jgi:hypothetical protein
VTVQTFLAIVVLVLAGHRISRFIGWDVISRKRRERFLGWNDNGQPNEWQSVIKSTKRKPLAEFIHCPWCQGFWISIAEWIAYRQEPHWTLLVLAPLAISSAIGVYTSHLDH